MEKHLFDYSRGMEAVKNLPRYYLGEEVNTPEGTGIIIKLEMEANGLYLSPERSKMCVWFSTSKAAGAGGRWVIHSWSFREIEEFNKIQNAK